MTRKLLPLLEGDSGFARRAGLSAAVALAVFLCNIQLGLQLPGITKVDIRPQIVLIAIVGYLFGPAYGFMVGFCSNLVSDLALGYGVQYIASWTTGNGLIGALAGLCPMRRRPKIDRIGQLGLLTLSLIVINILPFAYATGVQVLQEGWMSVQMSIRYFFVPAVLSNIVCMLVLFPAMLLAVGRVRLNFPTRIALINYYLAVFVVFVSWGIFALNLLDLAGSMDDRSIEGGNAFVVSFNHWTMLLVATLLSSLLVSGWVSKMLVSPIVRLERSVFDVLRGNPASLSELSEFSKRRDEIGVLGKTVSLLGEKLIHTQTLFRDEMNKRMDFIGGGDSASDIFVVGVVSMFGNEGFDSSELGDALKDDRKISNLSAVRILLDAAGLGELSATYTRDKVRRCIEQTLPGLDDILKDEVGKQSLALAIDMNLIFKGRLMVMDLEAPLESDFAYHLLENAQKLRHGGKHFIGHLTDNDIFEKLQERWFRSEEFSCAGLLTVMDGAIRDGVITGCQIKRVKDLANFDESLRIAYSHCNYKHVKQLVGLLVGEGVQAKLQLEPKLSVFLFLREWGVPPDLDVKDCGDGRFIAHRREFDVVLEFATSQQRDRFKGLVEGHAMREATGGKRLLFDSWVQPLFCSAVEVGGYSLIADLHGGAGDCVVHTYCRVGDGERIMAYFADRSLPLGRRDVWANDSFCRFIAECSK